jgi:hypothetical protein
MGSSRNSPSKAERRLDRKQRREAVARQNHRDKAKIREKEIKEEKKSQPKKPKEWKRRDKNGDIILWNAIKISKTSRYVLGGMAAIIILFAISPIFEDPNYVEPDRLSFAECEAIEFNDKWCMYDYKWTREYKDGGTISEYAEFDPFVDLPDLGNKYTPEEQDFLPPGGESNADFETDLSEEEWTDILKDFKIGNFILPLAYGTHDYLSGFAEHDVYLEPKETVLDEIGLDFVEDELPSTPEALTLLIDEIKLELDMTQAELVEVEREIQQWNIEEQKLDNERFSAESTYDDAEEDLEFSKKNYRHAQDIVVRTNEDRLEQDAAFKDYKVQVRIFEQAEKTYFRAMLLYDEAIADHLEAKNKAKELDDKLEELLQKLTKVKTKMNLTFRDYQFINVNLSKTCQTLIKYDLSTKCPTYREMIPLFDNTLPQVSGAFVELGYDMKRLPSPLTEHWNLYEQMTMTKVVSVDADTELFDRGINITIQAKDFVILEDTGRKNKSESYDSSTMERTEWRNIFVDERCSKVTVGPDLKAIEAAILHVLNKCTTDLSEFKTVITNEPTIISNEESAQWRYLQWIADLVASLRDDSNTK